MKRLHAGDLFSADYDEPGKTVWLTRTTRPSVGPIDAELRAIERALGEIDASLTLIIDVRDGPGRNDPDFEKRVLPQFQRVSNRFPRRAILVKTEVGRMQVRRVKEREGTVPVFTDEADARAFAAAALRR